MDSHLHGFGSNTMQSFPATSRFSTADESSVSRPSRLTDEDGTRNLDSSNPPETSMDSLGGGSTYSSAYNRVRAARPLFGDGSTALDADLEAASALNFLSTSPALKKRKTVGRDDEKQERPAARKSLFATVVGDGVKKQRK